MNKLEVNIAGLKLKNPICSASGCFGFGFEYQEYFNPNRLGAIVLKGITPEERSGNLGRRIVETPSGMLNSVGLQNPGIEKFLSEYSSEIEKELTESVVIANINGKTVEEFIFLATQLEPLRHIQAIEVNVSCPNIKQGGMSFGVISDLIKKVTQEVKKVSSKTIIVKLTPNVTSIAEMAKAAEDGGADVLSLINTVQALAIDMESKKLVLGNGIGGLSGPAVKPIALRCIYQVSEAVKIPIIGMGGVSNWRDVVEFMMAGASAVAIGSASFRNPMIFSEIISELENYVKREKLTSISDIVGCIHTN